MNRLKCAYLAFLGPLMAEAVDMDQLVPDRRLKVLPHAQQVIVCSKNMYELMLAVVTQNRH